MVCFGLDFLFSLAAALEAFALAHYFLQEGLFLVNFFDELLDDQSVVKIPRPQLRKQSIEGNLLFGF